jgi:hypothetical protein
MDDRDIKIYKRNKEFDKMMRWNQERISYMITQIIMRSNEAVIKYKQYGTYIHASPMLFAMIATTSFANMNTENPR